jgi:hypothetical protein
MKAAGNMYQTTQCKNPEDGHPQTLGLNIMLDKAEQSDCLQKPLMLTVMGIL